MTDGEVETIRSAFAADAVEYRGRMFVAVDRLEAYFAGKEVKVQRLILKCDDFPEESCNPNA